jgi:hypothetical protein
MTTYNRLFDEGMCISKYGFTAFLIEHCKDTVLKSTLAIAQWRCADSGNSADDDGYCLRWWKRGDTNNHSG